MFAGASSYVRLRVRSPRSRKVGQISERETYIYTRGRRERDVSVEFYVCVCVSSYGSANDRYDVRGYMVLRCCSLLRFRKAYEYLGGRCCAREVHVMGG